MSRSWRLLTLCKRMIPTDQSRDVDDEARRALLLSGGRYAAYSIAAVRAESDPGAGAE